MNTFENKENIIDPVDLRLQNLVENTVWNYRTIEFCKDLDEENTNKLNSIFAQFLIPQNKLETV